MPELRTMIEAVRGDGRNRDIRCPAHDDQRASLSVGRGRDDRVLLKCQAGCTLDAILAAANLEMRDLFPKTTTSKPSIVATYNYHDEGGKHLFDVCRFEPKDFRQRRADGVWKMDGVRRVLYHLNELQGQTVVYIAEGEKDVDRLRAIGFRATCNPGGASKSDDPSKSKWRDEYTKQLVAAAVENVVILPDNDDAGRAHAETIAASCHAAGLKVKVVTLPDVAVKGDISDWLDAGHTKAELVALVKAIELYIPARVQRDEQIRPDGHRVVHLTRASDIKIRPVRWLWDLRLALGTLGLLGGREGIGKSIVTYTLAALLTRGRLQGVYFGTPKSVIVAASEDSWEHTIVPRLMAAGADLERVFRADVIASDGGDGSLSLPRDLPELERQIRQEDAAMLVLDPLLSRIDSGLDSHKDAEVRIALEPLVKVAERTGCFELGLIHVNKSTSSDALTTLMASRAFAAVARSVLYAMVDPDNEQTRLLGQIKNNLGRSDLPSLSFQIVPEKVADTDEGPVWTGRLEWLGETDRSIKDAMVVSADMAGDKSATTEAADWLSDYLEHKGGSVDSATIKREGAKVGHNLDALKRARRKLGLVVINQGFPRQTFWKLPAQSGHPVGASSGETLLTTLTALTATSLTQSEQSGQLEQVSRGGALTEGGNHADDGRF